MSSNQTFYPAIPAPAELLHFDTATCHVKNRPQSMESIQMSLKVAKE